MTPVDALDPKIAEILAEISRGATEIIGSEHLISCIERFLRTGQRFIVKAGFDPSAPDLHLGHTILLQKMATLEKFGGEIHFLIGDFTARIGDPTGKSVMRKRLSQLEVEQNAATYKNQVFKILDPKKTRVDFNSTWLSALSPEDFIAITAHFSVARMLERDDFTKRYKAGEPISIMEFLYPLMQGYDSVEMGADIELGGNDQKFNLLMGRTLQKAYGKNQQAILMMPLLEGTCGVAKMSKSLQNFIALEDPPNDMFAKIMSISDALMWRYYELLSTKALRDIQILKTAVDADEMHPKSVKENLAREITARFWGADAADAAMENFTKVFSKKEAPDILDIIELEAGSDGLWICRALVLAGFCASNSEARRAILQNAVKIDGQKITDDALHLGSQEYLITLGKRKFARIKIREKNDKKHS